MDDLERMMNDLKRSTRGKKLSRNDRLLLDILSEITDILTSGFREKLTSKSNKGTSSTKEIRNEKVLSLRDFLRTRGRSDRRE